MNNPEPEGAEPSNGILEPSSEATLAELRNLAEEPFPPLPTAEELVDEIQAGIDAQYGPLTTPTLDYHPELATWGEIRERIEREKTGTAPPPTVATNPPPRRASRRRAATPEAG